MRRRDLISLIGGAAAWPFAAYGQSKRLRRVAVVLGVADDTEGHARLDALKKGMEALGWFEDRDVHFDVRYTAGNAEILSSVTSEILNLRPDLVVANTNKVVIALKQKTRAVPIIFAGVTDPVTAGIVESLSAPGGNITGFTSADFSLSAKSVETLTEIAPKVARLAILRDSTDPQSIGQAASVQMAAASLGMELTSIDIRDADTISRGIDLFARRENGGLVVPATPLDYQCQDGKGTRTQAYADAARPRRRGDRVRFTTSAFGALRQLMWCSGMSGVGGRPEVTSTLPK
jgi:putative tryptophan/tyrosine transport system substrate-binding protein